MPLNYYETNSVDPCYNLAFEEFLLTHKTEGEILMLWQNKNTVVVGRNQNTAEEINQEFVEKHKISVVRRGTGGGAVYHDLGNLNYSFIKDIGNTSEMSIHEFSKPVCSALEKMGAKAETSGRNDIIIEGKKISGAAQRIFKGRILHHGTLLFDSDVNMVSGALNANPEKFKSKSARSVKSRIGNIKDFLPNKISLAEFWQLLLKEFSAEGAAMRALEPSELSEVAALADEKYRSRDWNYGKNPDYSFENEARYPGGLLKVRILSENGLIKNIFFSGDFMAVSEIAAAEKALEGVYLAINPVSTVLETLDLSGMFGDIKKEEILRTIFDYKL